MEAVSSGRRKESCMKCRCMTCGKVWDEDQLKDDPMSTAKKKTCGDLFCGVNVVPVKGVVDEAAEQCKEIEDRKLDVAISEMIEEEGLKKGGDKWTH